MSQNAPVRFSRDHKRMILIPEGWFLMGTSNDDAVEMKKMFGWKSEWFADEMPQHRVYLDAYYIDETPVTNAEYHRFLEIHPNHAVPLDWNVESRRYLPEKEDHPVVHVSWQDAADYARWAGKRLPTEAEWEKAARGTDSRRFPWGDEFDPGRCNTTESHLKGTTSVQTYIQMGDSPYGLIDMAGNVWEWCADWYDAKYYSVSPTHNPNGPWPDDFRVLRGGCWDLDPSYARAASRDYSVPAEGGYALIGFRCVQPVG